MTWRDELRRVRFVIDGKPRDLIGASFRRVPFFVDQAELTTGRRTVPHEFPLRDVPFVEDMGQLGRKFKLDGYVIGADYLVQKNVLLVALEAKGPGELVHPYYGVRRAQATTATVRETRAEGGWAAFALEFLETPTQPPMPTVVDDPPSKVSTSVDAAATATKAQLAADYDATGLPSSALASAATAIQGAADALGAKLAPAVRDAQEAAALNGQLKLIAAQATSLATQPAGLIDQASAVLAGLKETAASSPGALMDGLIAAYKEALGPAIGGITSTRRREAANQAALTGAIRRTMAIEAARLAPRVPYASVEDATAARARIVAMLDEQAQTAGDAVYPALIALRAEVMRAVPGSAVLARIVTITRRAPVPSLVLAYQLYGSVAKEADIIARNKIRHPGFVSGVLKVLSNGE